MKSLLLCITAASMCCAPGARAQPQNDIMLPSAAAPAPDAQALGLARAIVAKTESQDISASPWLGMPMGMFMQHWHIMPRDHARVIFTEALTPVLQEHMAEFHEIEAASLARDLSLDDLKAVAAFYDSPAGLSLLRMHAPLLQRNMAGLVQLLQTLKPEMQSKIDDALKAHGWNKG